MTYAWVGGLVVTMFLCIVVGSGRNDAAMIATIISFPAALLLYFAPATVAFLRKHPKAGAITVLNLLTGWTLIGWVVSLVWAYTDGSEPGQEEALPPVSGVKKCPFCAEQINAEAIKCRYCGSDVTSNPSIAAAG